MKISVTAGEINDRGLWERLCDLTGLDYYAMNDGRMDSSHEIILTASQARALGLIPPDVYPEYTPF